ncbi:MAG TPA: hypothetical protein VIT42_03095 [Microlunatus sp.]
MLHDTVTLLPPSPKVQLQVVARRDLLAFNAIADGRAGAPLGGRARRSAVAGDVDEAAATEGSATEEGAQAAPNISTMREGCARVALTSRGNW